MDHVRRELLRGLAASQGGTTPQDQEKEQQDALKCSWSFGGPREEPQEAPKWGPRASQEGPFFAGLKQATQTRGFSMIRGLAVSQGGTKEQEQQEEQQEGPKGPMPIFDPRTLGRLWPQEAPK